MLSFLLVSKHIAFLSRPDSFKPSCNALTIEVFVKLASLPPFSITPLPDLIAKISSLAIRSGTGVMLKGGSEANLTNTAIVNALQEGLNESGLDKNAICLLTSRKDSMSMLNLENYINLIIPRGSNELVKFIQENTRIPVLGHADGICHLYIDSLSLIHI